MPLYEHFHSPLSVDRPWEGFHSAWATVIAQQLNTSVLPKQFVALPFLRRGSAVEIDVAALESAKPSDPGSRQASWTATQPTWTVPIDWNIRDQFEVRILDVAGPPRLAAAVELVSPANKDRPSHRQAFAGKCAGYLRQGIGLVVVDIVTERHDSLHRELVELLELNGSAPFDAALYAVAYRTIEEGTKNRLEIWAEPLEVGAALPTVPLWLTAELVMPLNLEHAYQETCRSLRIPS